MRISPAAWRSGIIAIFVFFALAGLLAAFSVRSEAGLPSPLASQPTTFATRVFKQGLNGYAGVADTTISFVEPDTQFDKVSYLRLQCMDRTRLPERERYGALLRFDLSEIPRNARIVSATLRLRAFQRNIADDLLVTVHVMTRTWDPQLVTWNRPAPGMTWGKPGANDTWFDRREKWESYNLFQGSRPVPVWYEWDVTRAVQYWVEQPQWNQGIRLMAYIGERRNVQYDVYSSEAATLADRPELVVAYTLDPSAPTPTDVPATPTPTPTRIPAGPIQSVTFQQGLNGYWGVEDTELNRRLPDINFSQIISLHVRWQDIERVDGQDIYVDRDEYNPLLRFDLRSIPSHALVLSARLYMYVFYRSNPSYLDVTSHQILRPWVASQATWSRAAEGLPWYKEGCGAPTWHIVLRFARGEWELPHWDYQVRESDWVSMNTIDTWYSFDVRDMVQKWVRDPPSNFGLILKPQVDVNVGYSFYSSEAPTQTIRPKLIVEYWLPADVPTATPTSTGGVTPTPTRTRTPTATRTSEPSATATPSMTMGPTSTASPTPTFTTTPSSTPSPTDTMTPTPTATSTPPPLRASFPLAGVHDVHLTMPLAVQFPARVVTYTFGFGLLPPADFYVTWEDPPTRVWLYHSPLARHTTYTLTITGGLTEDGREIAPDAWPFTTVAHGSMLPLLLVR